MARFTSAYSGYIARLDEVESLRLGASYLEKEAPIANKDKINALCRGGLVLLSSHLEAYIKELGEILVIRFSEKQIDRSKIDKRVFYHISKDRLDNLLVTSNPVNIADAVFEFLDSDYEYWSSNGPFPKYIQTERFNKGFSNPTFKKIKRYFNRFGFEEYSRNLGRKLKADYMPYVNMVDHLVDIRNKIAHGDPSATKTPQEVHDIVTIITDFCRATDSVFGLWCKENYCSIR